MKFEEAWLKFQKDSSYPDERYFETIYADTENAVIKNAALQIKKAAIEVLEKETEIKTIGSLVDGAKGICLKLTNKDELNLEGYRIYETNGLVHIEAGGENGILYGSFQLIRHLQLGKSIRSIKIEEAPANPLRILNHWDNIDGSIERGYSGTSFFFEHQEVLVNERTVEYARLMASIGINASVINNVNVKGNATKLISDCYYKPLKEMATIFSEYGIKLFLCVNFAAPMELGGLTTADPLDKEVKHWWKQKMQEVFEYIPNLGGFLVKADSEGRPGPFTYERTHADGANTLAEAVAPYGGLIIWRCFVYNCQQDWRDRKTDRARASYDNFITLDGKFLDNVILQIKNGPMDFQVREPVSPLIGALEHTNQILEVQIAQEYTGQQRHICYLIPMFKQILAFKTYCKEEKDTVEDIISGATFGQKNCGIAAVANTGNDENWTGHDFAAANLYGFGRLSFNTKLTAEEIAKEWATLTFGKEQAVVDGIFSILMNSWPAYEKYTSPLGIGWMVTPDTHYGPSVDGYEYSRWGTYHRADHQGIGVDRSKNGTGYALQYRKPNASMYDSIETCPEELLLFFHHMPYDYQLKSEKTIIQHIYDTHFSGVEDVESMIKEWKTLENMVDKKVYQRVLKRLEHQADSAIEWRDQINSYFYRKSGIEDEKNRRIY